MTTEESSSAKSRNPENYTFLDKEALSKYTTDTGKILPRKYSGLTPMQQRKVSKLIKKARHMQLVTWLSGFQLTTQAITLLQVLPLVESPC